MQKSALLVIDCQVDFHPLPGSALGVAGALEDTERTIKLIDRYPFDTIFASMDTHSRLDISHCHWFRKADGSFIDPFTLITANEVKEGKYTPTMDPKRTIAYLEDLERDGEYVHCVWPDHCIQGTPGHAFHPDFGAALDRWMFKKKRWVNIIRKGENPWTEHFGIFRANVPIPEDENTSVKQEIFNTMNNHDVIYLAGQAQSHCVANSLRQITQLAEDLCPKLVVLEDAMSPVPGLPSDFYAMVKKIYDNAKAKGVRFAKTTDYL